ncbi:MAG: hypothetical protein HY395_01170 [Candidatus Doudnabacteria bacterium]|nr:hypothetical protein [Candidatus Doudnabacteria bacterium]
METGWQFYTRVTEAWDSMLADIASARSFIDLDQYIFEPDRIGRRFLELLIQKAKQGVRVRVICDAAGSANLYNSGFPNLLSEAGIQIFFVNPISPWRIHNFTSWFFRDHKKILVVDGAVGHTGGVGINDRMSDWRDTNVRLTGPIVAEFARVFRKTLEIARRKRLAVIQNNPSLGEFGLLTSSPYLRSLRSFRYRKRYLRDLFVDKVKSAKECIYLTTPYFVPDFRLFSALQQQARSGLDVKLVVPYTSDHLSLDIAAASYFSLALASGIKVYRYRSHILHAKSAVIDDWSTVGSANLDNLSFWFCYEANIYSHNQNFTQELKRQFEADLTESMEVKLVEWKFRPIKQKLLELLTWPAHNFM